MRRTLRSIEERRSTGGYHAPGDVPSTAARHFEVCFNFSANKGVGQKSGPLSCLDHQSYNAAYIARAHYTSAWMAAAAMVCLRRTMASRNVAMTPQQLFKIPTADCSAACH